MYHIRESESIASVLTRISRGEGIHASITLIEGWTFEEVMIAIQKHPHITKTFAIDDISALSETLAIELSLGTPSIEGWIFPDTYFFNMGQVINSLFAGLSGYKRRLLMRFGNPEELIRNLIRQTHKSRLNYREGNSTSP